MTETERYLREYWFAKRSIGRLMLDLGTAKAALEQCNTQQSGVHAGALGLSEHAARLIISQQRAEVLSIEQRLEGERTKLLRINAAVKQAVLTEREYEYVRLRYFENRTVEAVCQRMYISPATGGRIRESILSKFSSVATELAI